MPQWAATGCLCLPPFFKPPHATPLLLLLLLLLALVLLRLVLLVVVAAGVSGTGSNTIQTLTWTVAVTVPPRAKWLTAG
jgi:hypothetical protein